MLSARLLNNFGLIMQRLLHVIGDWQLAGAEKQLAGLAGRQAQAGWQVEIVVLRGELSPELVELAEPCPVTLLPGRPQGLRRYRALVEKVQHENWQLLAGQLFSGNLYAVAAGHKLGLPVLTFEGGLEPWRRWYHWSLCRWYWKRAAYVEVNADAVGRNVVAHGGNPDKLRLIYNGIEPSKLLTTGERLAARQRFNLPAEAPVVVMVANLHAPKDPRALLQAVVKLQAEFPELRLLFAGDGTQRSGLEQLINQLGMAEQVQLLGRVADVREVYAAADVFCLSSLAEGLSNAIIEALSLQLPCLVSEAGGNGELVANGERGLTFPAGNVSACAAGLSKLLTNKEEAAGMAQNGRRWVEQELSWENNLEQHRRLYEEATERHSTSRRQR